MFDKALQIGHWIIHWSLVIDHLSMRILIATVTAGAGHLQAAAALEEAWRALRPRDQLEKLNVLDFTPRLYRKVYIESYVKLVEHAPELWLISSIKPITRC